MRRGLSSLNMVLSCHSSCNSEDTIALEYVKDLGELLGLGRMGSAGMCGDPGDDWAETVLAGDLVGNRIPIEDRTILSEGVLEKLMLRRL